MAEGVQRGLKRRKFSHSQSRHPPSAGFRSDGNTRTGTATNRQIRSRPPRAIRTSGRDSQALANNVDVTHMAETNNKPFVRPPTMEPDRTITTLSFVKSLLDKIWARNKNQHRMQPWWKTLSMLRKAITRLSALGSEDRLLQTQAQALGSNTNARDVRKRFESETQLRREQEVWKSWLREVLVPRAYLGFSSLVGNVQFANVGVVLIGLLADVVSVVGSPTNDEGNDDDAGAPKTNETRNGGGDFVSSQARLLLATSLRRTGLPTGELIERQYDSDDLGEVIERKPDDRIAKQRRVTGVREAKEGTNISFDDVELRETDLAALPSNQEKRARVEEKADRSELPVLYLADGKTEVIGQELGGGKSKLATGSNIARERGKTKPVKSNTKAKKSKNMIDNLFAGLT